MLAKKNKDQKMISFTQEVMKISPNMKLYIAKYFISECFALHNLIIAKSRANYKKDSSFSTRSELDEMTQDCKDKIKRMVELSEARKANYDISPLPKLHAKLLQINSKILEKYTDQS